ncbi:MAG TPA: VWA domain-containing protein [Verrucomicrobiae bacterium]|nr:VWA domain-containing protein [Verrucomicrobiae bacterium]
MNTLKSQVLRRTLAGAALLMAAMPALAARDVMLVLDNSGSMRRNDPQRLAGPAVAEFIQSQPDDTRVGILLFTSDPDLVMPLTPTQVAADGDAQRALRQFNYSGQWTQTAGAMERALYELRVEGRKDADRVIVLMTDGLIDTGDRARDANFNRWLREDLAAQAARENVRVFGIAFTERADYQLLQALASKTGGEYFRVLNASGIAKALQGIEGALSAASVAVPAPTPVPPVVTPAPSPAPVQSPPQAEPVPAPASSPGATRWLYLVAGLLLLAGFGGFAWWWLQYRPRSADRATAATSEPPLRAGGPLGVLFDQSERHEIGDQPVVVGRSGGTDPARYYLIVPEKTVGRWHATIERRGQTFWLRDEGSVNGTFINGERVVGERPLKHRDTVRFHNHQFEFEIPELADSDRTVLQPSQQVPAI